MNVTVSANTTVEYLTEYRENNFRLDVVIGIYILQNKIIKYH
jgi:hypothetical protein